MFTFSEQSSFVFLCFRSFFLFLLLERRKQSKRKGKKKKKRNTSNLHLKKKRKKHRSITRGLRKIRNYLPVTCLCKNRKKRPALFLLPSLSFSHFFFLVFYPSFLFFHGLFCSAAIHVSYLHSAEQSITIIVTFSFSLSLSSSHAVSLPFIHTCTNVENQKNSCARSTTNTPFFFRFSNESSDCVS